MSPVEFPELPGNLCMIFLEFKIVFPSVSFFVTCVFRSLSLFLKISFDFFLTNLSGRFHLLKSVLRFSIVPYLVFWLA